MRSWRNSDFLTPRSVRLLLQITPEQPEQSFPMPLRAPLVVDALAQWKRKAVLSAGIPLDARAYTGNRFQMRLQLVHHFLRRVLVGLGARKVQLAADLVGATMR